MYFFFKDKNIILSQLIKIIIVFFFTEYLKENQIRHKRDNRNRRKTKEQKKRRKIKKSKKVKQREASIHSEEAYRDDDDDRGEMT